MEHKSALSTLLFYFILAWYSIAQNYNVKSITVNEGLASDECNFASVDNFGYVWIGHPKGALTRYDGGYNSELLDNSTIYNVNCVDYQPDGTTWFGSDETGLACWFQRKWFYYKSEYGFKDYTVTKGIYCDNKSQLILGTKDSLRIYTISENHILSKKYQAIFLQGLIHIKRLNNEAAQVLTNRGLYLYVNGKLNIVTSKTNIAASIIDIDLINNDRVIVTTKNKVYEAKLLNNEVVDEKLIFTISDLSFLETTFERNKVYSAVPGLGFYMYNFDTRKVSIVNSMNGLKYTDINGIAADKEGYVYLTTEKNGVQVFGLDYIKNFSKISNLAVNGILAQFKSSDGSLWVANKNGRITNYKNQVVNEFMLDNNPVYDIIEFNEQVLFATNRGVFEYSNNQIVPSKKFPVSKCNRFLKDKANRLWIAFDQTTGIYCVDQNRVTIYENGKLGLPISTSFIQIREDIAGNIYFAENHSIYKLSQNKFVQILDDTFRAFVINDFDIDLQSHFWIATKNGFFHWYQWKFEKIKELYAEVKSDASNYSGFVEFDRLKNKMYVGTNYGLLEILFNKNGQIKDNYFYGLEEGLIKAECLDRVSHLDASGDFYFATNAGLHVLNNDHEFPIYFSYDIFLSYLSVNYKTKEKFIPENYLVNRSLKKYHFDFDYDEGGTFSLHFRDLTKGYFSTLYCKTKMLPDESAWIDQGNLNFSFNFLSPGLHTFILVPYERYTLKEKEPIIIELYFKGAWYQSASFFAIFFGLFSLIFIVILRSFRNYDKEKVYDYNLMRDASSDRSNLLVIIIGALFLPASALVFRMFVPNIDNLLLVNVLIGLVLLGYFVLVKIRSSLLVYSQKFVVVSLYVYTLFDLFLIYYTKMHPYYFIGLLLIAFASVSILQYLKEIIIYIFIFCLGALAVYFVASTSTYSYDKNLFIIGILFTTVILVMNLIVKLNVQEKLYFSDNIVNNSSSLVMSGDTKGNIKFVSNNFENILGYKKEEVMGQAWWAITAKSNEDAVKNKNFVLSEVKEDEPYVRAIRNKSGQFKYIQWVDKSIGRGDIVSVGQDITDKKELEDKFKFLLENAEDGFFQTNAEGKFLFVTTKIEEIMQTKKEDLVGKYYHDLVRSDYSKKIILHYMRQLKNGVPASYVEFPVKRNNNTDIWLGQTAKMVYDDSGIFLGFIAVTRDITDKRKVEEIMRQKNKDFTDNLNYAKRMQDALLPSHVNLQVYLKNIFLVSHPRDVVSGDFSFIERVGDKLVIALGDCTGHGFTGAFMTVLGTNILKTLINRKNELSPDFILKELDAQIDTSLNKLGKENEYIMRDGMEIGVCVFDTTSQTLEYAGAGLSLFYVEDNVLNEVQGDFKQIGNLDIQDFQYAKQVLKYAEATNFYMFSDGFQDQFGGPDKKKFSRKRAKQVLLDLQNKSVLQQKIIIEETFNNWKGNIRQTDDFIFLGFNLGN